MENKIQVFTNEKFGKVRTLMINNEPWFVGKDVAVALGYKDTSDALKKHVDTEDKLTRRFADSGQSREMYIINESGVYSLVLSSKLPTAKKFKRWVTSEVLPSIRKTGGYSLEIPKDYPSALRALADQCEINRIMKPKADFYDTVASTESLLSMNDTAKILNMGVGRNKLFKLLRDKKILMKDNMPYQRYVDAGYFKMVESYYMAGDNSVVSKTTYVRQRGVDYIRKLLNECA
ncbi:phage repressor protein/antirepressor Ant [Veillonellaceae bacterium WCA-693-APC-5D-A]|uniref:Phage repressor protein/antirepressor Ant n=1 Tax=Anaerovibrio slackiae TaxID=2652309 RepID=A0A6I2UEG0_9FIRM|nr:phage antirepressor KilAC domain-containing protein [Anaerovibrio slackiae]MSU08235.1 phage repressor protein/antirepressor Ant [Anaerovibrio slackiae]